jgi:long-chain fatty acid transport protein
MTNSFPTAPRSVFLRRETRARLGALLGFLLVGIAIESHAHAAGLYFSDRGVRPLGRAGAFVAGADDVHAMWYNPAGLADAGNSFLVDAAWLNFSVDFKRKAQVTDAGGTIRNYEYPSVTGTTSFVPIPTLGITLKLGDADKWTFGGGINVPYGVISTFPRTQNGLPAASRYSLLSLDGSALLVVTGNLAYKASKEFRIGFGLQSLVGKFATSVMFNANPADRFIGAPEDPNYDTFARLDVAPIVTLPSVNLGATWVPSESFRIAVSGFTPFYVYAPATTQVQLPSAPVFDRAKQEGTSSTVSFWLPPVLRAGIEARAKLSIRTLR